MIALPREWVPRRIMDGGVVLELSMPHQVGLVLWCVSSVRNGMPSWLLDGTVEWDRKPILVWNAVSIGGSGLRKLFDGRCLT
jgi:hypothetical protein